LNISTAKALCLNISSNLVSLATASICPTTLCDYNMAGICPTTLCDYNSWEGCINKPLHFDQTLIFL
jgi:hypothetical protein